jgi:hypothetical protein
MKFVPLKVLSGYRTSNWTDEPVPLAFLKSFVPLRMQRRPRCGERKAGA